MGLTSTSNSLHQRTDKFLFYLLPKLLIGSILVILVYLTNLFSTKISYIFDSPISLQDMFGISINFYFLSGVTILLLAIWVVMIFRSTTIFFSSIFVSPLKSKTAYNLFKMNIFLLSFVIFIFLDFFLPQSYLLTGLYFVFKQLEYFLEVHIVYFPLIVSFNDYSTFASVLLLCSIELIAFSSLILFILHVVYYFQKNSGMNEHLSLIYTFQIGKTLLFVFTPILVLYFVLVYNSITDFLAKLILVFIILGLALWFVYKITSNYYYGLTNSFFSNDISITAFVMVLIGFYIAPLILWFMYDFNTIYFLHSLQGTPVGDFGKFLTTIGFIPKEVLTKPYLIDPVSLLILSTVSIERIVFIDVFLIIIFGLMLLIYYQFRYIINYFKSKYNTEFKKLIEFDNTEIFRFNSKIQGSIILHLLFILFILFLGWDVVAVTYNTFIVPVNASVFPDISNYLIITVLLSNFSSLQTPFDYTAIIFMILLFIAVLIVFNIVSIKINEQKLQYSSFGAFYLLSISFILISGFLLYDLQNYDGKPLQYFQTITLFSYLNFDYTWFISLVVFCDSLFFLYVVMFFITKVTKRIQIYRKLRKEKEEAEIAEKLEKTRSELKEQEELVENESKETSEEVNPEEKEENQQI